MQLEEVEHESDITQLSELNIHTVSESVDQHDMSDHPEATTANTTARTVTDCTNSRNDLSDTANWPCQITDSQRLFLVLQGPCRLHMSECVVS